MSEINSPQASAIPLKVMVIQGSLLLPRLLRAAHDGSPAPPPEEAKRGDDGGCHVGGFGSEVGIILAALVCVILVVLGVGAMVRWRLMRCRQQRVQSLRAMSSACPNMWEELKAALPVSIYPKATSMATAPVPAECVICLAEFVEGEEVRVLPLCRHSFHAKCIDTWLSVNSAQPSCPSCRHSVLPETGWLPLAVPPARCSTDMREC